MEREELEFMRKVSQGENIRNLLENADESIISNPDLMKFATLEWRGAFKYASDKLKRDKTFIIDFLKSNYGDFPLEYAAPEVRTDEELMLQIASIDPRTLSGADQSLLDDKEFMKKVVRISPIPFAYSNLTNDEKFVEELVEINGMTFEFAREYWENRQILMKAAKNNGEILNNIPISRNYLEEYLEDEELLLEAAQSMISREGTYSFSFIHLLSDEMKQKLHESKELNESLDAYWTKRRQELKSKEGELSSLEAEAKTIDEAEVLIDQQRSGQNIGEE